MVLEEAPGAGGRRGRGIGYDIPSKVLSAIAMRNISETFPTQRSVRGGRARVGERFQ